MEFMSNSIHNMILPLMVTEAVGEAAEAMAHNRELKKLLKRYHPSSISLVTIYCWMIHLGFKCEPRKKGYYVNDNEKPAMISYRCAFCEQYLGYEQCMHHWVQISKDKTKVLENSNALPRDSGYRYVDEVTQGKRWSVMLM